MKEITLMIFALLLSLCGYAQFPEGFETGFTLAPTGTSATGWFTMQNDVGLNVTWIQGAANSSVQQPAHTGERAAYLQRDLGTGSIPKDYLVTPVFTVPANPELHFFSRLTQLGDQGSIYKIFILNLTAAPMADLNSPASYTELQTWTELQINPDQTSYIEKIVPIPAAYAGAQVRIAFMMAGGGANSDRWLIDDVAVVKKCERPTTLTATNLGLYSADLSWLNPGNAAAWDIELILEAGAPTGIPTYSYSGGLPFQVPAGVLAEDTCYKYYVRSNCGTDGKSDWQEPAFFCTKRLGDTCADPIAVTTLPYTDTDNTNGFSDEYEGTPGTGCNIGPGNNYLNGNDAVYKYVAAFTGKINIDLTDVGPYAGVFVYASCSDIGVACLNGGVSEEAGNNISLDDFDVITGDDYYIVISSYSQPTTPYTLTIQAVACDEPVGLPAANIGMTSAELSWTNPTGAASWEVAVQPKGTGVPQGTGETVTDNTNYVWDDLAASTAYEYWVRADCGNGTFSAWAGPYYFNTMLCEVANQCSFTFTMWDDWDGWSGNTMAVKQNGITIATLTGPGDDGEPVEVNVPVCNGIAVQLFWNSGGSSAPEVGVSITNAFNQVVFTKPPGQSAPNSLLYNTVVDCENPSCITPKNLSVANVTQTTADLSWEGPETGQWEYYIVEAGQPAPANNQTGTSTTTNPAINAGPLTAATNYEYYVRMICETSNTDWSQPFAFSTSVCDPADKCDYRFVLTNNLGWGGWNGSIMTVKQNGANVALLGPSFTDGATQTITVPLCPGVPFEIFWNTVGEGWEEMIGLTVLNKFNQVVFDHPIGSTGVNTTIHTGEVDCENPACVPPTGLTASNATMTSIDLAWDGPENGNWQYVIVPAGDPAPEAATPGTATSSNPTIAAPLSAPGTKYDYYVRMICDDPDMPVTDWAGPHMMNSEICDAEDKCIFLFELQSQNSMGYEGAIMAVYQEGILIKLLGPGYSWGDTQTVEVALCPNKEMQIVWEESGWGEAPKGLHVYSPYMEDIYIKGFNEGAPSETLYTGMVSCDPPACPRPLNLTTSNTGLTSVTLQWDEMGNAASWEVWVLPLGSPAPTADGTIVTSNSIVWNQGLLPSTPYIFYVRAVCNGSGTSTISGPFKFVTAIGNETCDTAVLVPVNSGQTCTTSVPGTLNEATISGVVSSCMIFNQSNVAYDDVWYKFVAQAERHAISIHDQVNVQVNYVVFEGTDCNNLTEVTCGSNEMDGLDNNGIIEGLTIGNTYLIQMHDPWRVPETIASFEVCITTPISIIVDNTTFTPEQIVNNALVTEACTTIENITWSTGTNFGQDNGIGYFEKGQSEFPIEKGIVLMTGNAKTAMGPNVKEYLSGGKWSGDDDLFNYMQGLGIDPGLQGYADATVVEFDFTSASNKLKFPFIFASEEYGRYQCDYSDAFAFFLTTDNGSGPVTVNLAVVPATDSPISVITIRDYAFNLAWNECPSINETYFDKYYGNNATSDAHIKNPELATDPLLAPINFEGHTVKMFAQADIVPNQVYHIKLVIADRNDSSLDSAVFIGKFSLGSVDLGPDLTIENGNALCMGVSHTIESGLDPNEYTFKWFKNGDLIVGETGENLIVTSTGVYSLEATFGGGCTTEDTIKVEFYPDLNLATGNPVPLTVCDPDGFGTFNLSDNTAVIVGTNPDQYTVSYHLTEAQAQANEGALPLTNYENTTQFEQVIYVRIVDTKGCIGIKFFKLLVQDFTPLFTVTQGIEICKDTVGTEVISVTPVSPANYDPAIATYSWTLNGEILPYATASITALETGVYEVTVNNKGCIASDKTIVTEKPAPTADMPSDVIVCASYKLPALSPNNNYYTGPGGTGQILSEGDIIFSTQTMYVYAESATAPKCTSQSSFVITIVPSPIITTTQGCDGNEYIVEVIFDTNTTYSPDNTIIEWTNSSGIVVGNKEKVVVTESGIYTLTIIPIADIQCPLSQNVIVTTAACSIPKGISPNGDGMNDEFDLSSLKVRQLAIFNRYGQEVYSKSNYTKEWYGQGSNGNELPTGTYYYKIDRTNDKTITGWVYINREE